MWNCPFIHKKDGKHSSSDIVSFCLLLLISTMRCPSEVRVIFLFFYFFLQLQFPDVPLMHHMQNHVMLIQLHDTVTEYVCVIVPVQNMAVQIVCCSLLQTT